VAGASSSLKSGQIGMQCANVCEPPTGSFYLNNCSCAAGSDYTLYNFTKADFDTYDSDASCPGASCAYEEGDAPYDAYDYATSPKSASRTASGDEIWTGASGDAANKRYVLVGPHIPEGVQNRQPPWRQMLWGVIATTQVTQPILVVNT
jgi:hypothetical protein